MLERLYDSSAIYIDQLHLSNYALLLVVVLLLALIALLLIGIPRTIKAVKK